MDSLLWLTIENNSDSFLIHELFEKKLSTSGSKGLCQDRMTHFPGTYICIVCYKRC